MATSTPPASTASIAPTSDTPSSTAPSTSTSAQPSPPPKPTWSDNPQGFIKVFEQDGVASAFYDASSNSASEGITSNIEAWCLGKCAGQCKAVFLYRKLQFTSGAYNPYFICNQYNKQWSNDFVHNGIDSNDAGVAFNKQ